MSEKTVANGQKLDVFANAKLIQKGLVSFFAVLNKFWEKIDTLAQVLCISHHCALSHCSNSASTEIQ